MKERDGRIPAFGRMEPEQDLVAAGQIGLSGTARILRAEEAALLRRFSPLFVKRCRALCETGGAAADPGFFEQTGAASWCAAGEGGIFAALWDYFEAFGLGFEIELRRIPILQETVEICELFDLNPYRLHSEGCLLFTAASGTEAVLGLRRRGIAAAVIGRTRSGIARKIRNGEIGTFLDRPQPDEIEKMRYRNAGF